MSDVPGVPITPAFPDGNAAWQAQAQADADRRRARKKQKQREARQEAEAYSSGSVVPPKTTTASWWPTWLTFWDAGPVKPMKPTDAIRNESLRTRFAHFLHRDDPPATFKASEVAQELTYKELQSMGYERWQDVLPAVIELAFEQRAFGYCEILKDGKLVGEDVSAFEIEGGIRIRRYDG